MNCSRRTILTAVVLASVLAVGSKARAAERSISSPDGNIEVVVTDQDGKPTYRVSLGGQPLILNSPLGVATNYADLTQGLSMKDCEVQSVSLDYRLGTWKQSHIQVETTRAVCHFEKEGRPALDIVFHVSNRDVAFRYKLYPKRGRGGETLAAVISGEASGFVLPSGTTTFLCPQSKPMTGFARTAPSYETGYTLDDQPGKNGWGEGYTFPCLFKVATPTGTNGWILVSETGTDGSYVGCRLVGESADHAPYTYRIGFPQAGEMNGQGTTGAAVSLPFETPWRTITLGTTLANIVESTVANDLVQPKYQASKDYTYGKGSWSWIIGMDASCNFDEQKRYIDFSAAMGWRSVLVDALWDTQIGYEKMEELSRYARSKGVGLFLWYNSNGAWNDAPQGPRHKMDKSAVRRKEMAWMQQNGIQGIKVDFFGGDKQTTMKLYEDILFDANRYGLQCIFHGCTLPRGWERMYPNYVASEAVLASENVFFGEGAAIREPFDLCMHPYCRNAVATMDWGGIIMNKFMAPDNHSRHPRHTTDIFEMASGITMQTAIQCVAMQPNNLTENELPTFELEWLRQMPTTWEETRYIDGYPGRYVVLARRHANEWYVAGLNAQKEPLKLTLDVADLFPAGTQLKYYVDDRKTGQPVLTSVKTDRKGKVKVEMQPNGGLILQK